MLKRKVRILFLIDDFVSDQAGTESQLLKLINGLPKNRFQCHLACFNSSSFLNTKELGIPLFFWGSSSLRSYKFYHGLIRFLKYLRKHKIDIVQAHFPTAVTAGVLASYLGTFLGGIRAIVSCRRDMGFWYTPLLKLILRLSNLCVTQFLANSIEVKKHLERSEKVATDKITVIYNGIDLPRILSKEDKTNLRKECGLPRDSLVVGTVANMNRRVKRVDLFIKAAAYVLDELKNTYFLVIGSGQLLKELKALAKKFGVADRMIFLGSKDNTEHFIQTFDVGVNSSDSEGFSNAVLEYMANGIAVVATSVGGNREIVQDGSNGFLVAPGNERALSDAIIGCLTNTEKRRRISSKARECALRFTTEKMIKKYESFYTALINEG